MNQFNDAASKINLFVSQIRLPSTKINLLRPGMKLLFDGKDEKNKVWRSAIKFNEKMHDLELSITNIQVNAHDTRDAQHTIAKKLNQEIEALAAKTESPASPEEILSAVTDSLAIMQKINREMKASADRHAKAAEERITQLDNIFRDTSEHTRSMQDDLHNAIDSALNDELTGLRNRKAYQEIATEAFAEAQAESTPFSLIVCDIDYFKRFNDAYGHTAGDEVLKHFSAVLDGATRKTDLVARYGGEEFVILLPHTNESDAVIIADKIRSSINNSLLTDNNGGKHKITASFGVSEYKPDDSNYQLIFERADKALYLAKHTGRNSVSSHTDLLQTQFA